ncbi:MAG: LysR family transcriptional regulator [Lachnospiraceae bacterium]|nr:LysR family transcriptional regulator [Lachnospiraceae bacterium]
MDTKLQTFLVLCRFMNYRLTAEELHLTQPAVTKQIQALEQLYQTKLFTYDGRKLEKTSAGLLLEEYAQRLQYNYEEIQKALKGNEEVFIRIGATKTIGDYVIGDWVAKYLSFSNHRLSLIIDNTERLLHMLDSAQLDFVILEGLFNKKKYDFQLLKKELFVGICPKNHRFAGKRVSIAEILKEAIIVREEGSGTRDILEFELKRNGYELTIFSKVTYISSFKLIRELVLKGFGISFVYSAVVEDAKDSFATFMVENFNFEYEFNIVYLKNTNAKKHIKQFFQDGNK